MQKAVEPTIRSRIIAIANPPKKFGLIVGLLVTCCWLTGRTSHAEEGILPPNFAFLRNIDPTIIQDIRYATANNFTGAPVPGYTIGECVVLRDVAIALKNAQRKLRTKGLSLKVFDCYRPVQSVQSFIAWTKKKPQTVDKHFYPRLSRRQLVSKGYIGKVSTHSRGIAVDVTLVVSKMNVRPLPTEEKNIETCIEPASMSLRSNELDMGTGFDCFDKKSHVYSREISDKQQTNRRILKHVMTTYGFKGYAKEWWHFSYTRLKYLPKRHDFPIARIAD